MCKLLFILQPVYHKNERKSTDKILEKQKHIQCPRQNKTPEAFASGGNFLLNGLFAFDFSCKVENRTADTDCGEHQHHGKVEVEGACKRHIRALFQRFRALHQ